MAYRDRAVPSRWARLSIALHEVGSPGAGEAVRRPLHPVHGRLRPDRLVARIGDTEYGVKAIPLGGYVRMLGMFPPKPGRPARADTTGRSGRWSTRPATTPNARSGPRTPTGSSTSARCPSGWSSCSAARR